MSDDQVESTGRTSKVRRNSSSLFLQAPIVSLSLLAWTSRENSLRLHFLVTFLWISATVLRSGGDRGKRIAHIVDLWSDSPPQLLNRLVHRWTEIARFLPLHPPVEGLAYPGAEQPKIDVIGLVGHRVLFTCEQGTPGERRNRTLINVRRTLTEANTGPAGVVLEASFAMSKVLMATLSREMARSLCFGRWEFGSMGGRGSCGGRCDTACAERPGP